MMKHKPKKLLGKRTGNGSIIFAVNYVDYKHGKGKKRRETLR